MYYIRTNVQATSEPNIQSSSQIPSYSLYWTRFKGICLNKSTNKDISFAELNMKRKALTLQHTNTQSSLKKSNLYTKAVKNQNRITGRFINNNSAETLKCVKNTTSTASKSDVPGNKSFILYDNSAIPIYNYVPVKRTYKGGNNKYPYTAWEYGMQGFPVGKKGSSLQSRQIAQQIAENNSNKYSKNTTSYNCYSEKCFGKNIELELDIDNIDILISENIENIEKNIKLKPIYLNPDYIDIRFTGQVWFYTNKNNIFKNDKNNYMYVYILSYHKNEWWFSISATRINIINRFLNTVYKQLSYLIYCSYPFIEFKLEKYDKEDNKYYISEIYSQINKVTSDIDNINLNIVTINGKPFTTNHCLLNSSTKLFFNTTKKNVLTNTFWWRNLDDDDYENLFYYGDANTKKDLNFNNNNFSIEIKNYYKVCTTALNFTTKLLCLEE